MIRTTFAGTAVLLLAGLGASDAYAQRPVRGGTPVGAPTVSPYLNLLRNNNSPALNYFGLVRPQLQTNADLRALNEQFLQSRAGLPVGGEPEDQLVTGHAATFLNLGGYFQTIGGGSGVTRATLGTAVRSTTPGSSSAGSTMRLPRPGIR